MLRAFLWVVAHLVCFAVVCFAGASAGGPLGAEEGAPEVRVAPTNAGLSLSPFGVSLELSLTEPTLLPDARLSGTLGYDGGVVASHIAPYGVYGFARYDVLHRPSVVGAVLPLNLALQGGTWPHAPHLAGSRTAALGVKGYARGVVPAGPVTVAPALELALVQLAGAAAPLFDGRAELGVRAVRLDRWGYEAAGWQGSLVGLWSASVTGPSLGGWAEGAYTAPVGDTWRLTSRLRAGYRPAWPVPLVATSELAALATVGVSRSVALPAELLPGLLRLERLTLEPRVRGWVDAHAHVGADVTLWADTLVTSTRPVAAGVTVGYTNAPWVRLELRAAP